MTEPADAQPTQLDLWPDDLGQPAWMQNAQGSGSSALACTAFSIGAAAYWLELDASGEDPGTPDFAFLYNNEAHLTASVFRKRRVEIRQWDEARAKAEAKGFDTTRDFDTFNIHAAARVAGRCGVRFLPPTELYTESAFVFTPAPPFKHYVDARQHRYEYEALLPPLSGTLGDLAAKELSLPEGWRTAVVRAALIERTPVAMGIILISDMKISPEGDLPALASTAGYASSSHAVLVVGFDDETQRFRFRNSWGPEWGTSGFGTIPYDRVDSRDATFGFHRLLAATGAQRQPVMFESLRIENQAATTVRVAVDAFDGEGDHLGASVNEIAASESVVRHPVRWFDAYRLVVAVEPPDRGDGLVRAVDLRVDDPDGAVARAAEIVIPQDPARPPSGSLHGAAGRRLGCASAG